MSCRRKKQHIVGGLIRGRPAASATPGSCLSAWLAGWLVWLGWLTTSLPTESSARPVRGTPGINRQYSSGGAVPMMSLVPYVSYAGLPPLPSPLIMPRLARYT